MKRVLLLTTAVAMAALVIAQQSRIELKAVLTGNGNDKGKAVWKTRDFGNQKQAQLQVEGENLVPGMDYTIFTAGYSWEVFADGVGRIRLSQRYTTATRPNIENGTPIWVEDANGATVLSGAFH